PLVSVYEIDGPPTPDVLVYNTNFGHDIARWFEYYSRRFGVPVLGLHPPAAVGSLDYVEVDAAVQQMLRLIGELERVTGRKLDYDHLAETVDLSARASRLWSEILDLARTTPAPLTYFDLLAHMAPMLLLRGTPQALEYLELVKSELEERVESGLAAVPGERFRFYWEGPPIWCALRPLSELFLQRQAAVVAGTYSSVFALAELDRNNPIATMARAYTGIFPNRSDDYKAAFLTSQFKEYGVDGVIYHEGRTSPEHSNVRYGLEVRLRRETGLPSLVLEADTHDLRLFSMDQIERQLADFIEQQNTALAAGPERA
ncbi:MAG: 2-hydroxyacyl-CoA dehydratase, partial [Candidatus Eisenbacteria bacterium]|nr:2-hydroxyacyl-CoA dehydratase [Candidatus Eisenbacteria bacterium]